MRLTPSHTVLALLVLGSLWGCTSRPINPKITQIQPHAGYRFENRRSPGKDRENLVILAFSGGGTRAAAFSYGVLEFLRRTEISDSHGNRTRLIDQVDVITGVSGGSFTALAYGLYGDKLFENYEAQFLKRNIQGELVGAVLNPLNWPTLLSPNWGRSEMAAKLYDKVLFKGATYADLSTTHGPFIIVTATDITNGARVTFDQRLFDVLCSDVSGVRLSRAAASSSAVPVALSPVTLNNYGGTCNYTPPEWAHVFQADNPPRPAARVIRDLKAVAEYQDSNARPYLHLVDGGVSDNLGMRGVLNALETLETLHDLGQPTPLDTAKRIVVFVVNSLSTPPIGWDKHERAPGSVAVLLQASGVPIDHYSYEAVELLKDTAARWQKLRELRDSPAFIPGRDPAADKILRVPNADIFAIDVSFPKLKDEKERAFLNKQPTSFHLPNDAVDRLRAAAGQIIQESPEFQRFSQGLGIETTAKLPGPPDAPPATPAPESALP